MTIVICTVIQSRGYSLVANSNRSFKKLVQYRSGVNGTEIEKSQGLAHREGRTRSLQIRVVMRPCTHRKSLTLYPIELGGHLGINGIRAIRPCKHTHTAALNTKFVYAHFCPLY
jgi:hypothetical protein